jgi:hypothetical protein
MGVWVMIDDLSEPDPVTIPHRAARLLALL